MHVSVFLLDALAGMRQEDAHHPQPWQSDSEKKEERLELFFRVFRPPSCLGVLVSVLRRRENFHRPIVFDGHVERAGHLEEFPVNLREKTKLEEKDEEKEEARIHLLDARCLSTSINLRGIPLGIQVDVWRSVDWPCASDEGGREGERKQAGRQKHRGRGGHNPTTH